MKNLIMIPFAYLDSYSSGVNINKEKSLEIYLKNIVVAALSAKNNAGGGRNSGSF